MSIPEAAQSVDRADISYGLLLMRSSAAADSCDNDALYEGRCHTEIFIGQSLHERHIRYRVPILEIGLWTRKED